MAIDFQRLEQILAEASARAGPRQRAVFLDGACGGDRELRAQVERLLAASREAGDFLEEAVEVSEASEGAVGPDLGVGMERPGSCIGRFKLLEEIGEGGFGIVFMAEQTEPVQRKVALKVVKAGMDTREVVARFEAERQALALMDHPNIARVLDGGETQGGRPYFVMELVCGIPITEFCDQRRLSTHERLRLFIRVCHAVQHAHQKGIIHRDLKPSNILVTLVDGQPLPKVIDFGVAKALGQKLTRRTLFTGFLRMVGTPAYMSPEQADLSGVDIDTRADVYALGVLLYELLTGVTPFDRETLHQAALDEIRRMIRETEPPKPSTRLGTMGARLTKIAEYRQSEPTALSRLLRGDLDWIVMKCLEKERQRRYESANNLAEDIQRHLTHQPVWACPPSTAYRLRKFTRRNKVALATFAAVVFVLVLGSLVSILQAIRATRAERLAATRLVAETRARLLADNARTQALAEASRAIAASDVLRKALQAAQSRALPNADDSVRELLDSLSASVADQTQEPAVEASIRATLGNAYRRLGATDQAQPHLEAVLALRRRVFGDGHEQVAQALLDLGANHHDREDYRTAEKLFRNALDISTQLNLSRLAVQASASLEGSLKALGRFEEAEQVARGALPMADVSTGREALASSRWPEPASAAAAGWLELARLCFDLEEQSLQKVDRDKTRSLFLEAARRGGVDYPELLQSQEWTQRGYSAMRSNQWDSAITAYSRAIEIQPHVPSSYTQRGYCYLQLTNLEASVADYTRAIRLAPHDSGMWACRGLVQVRLGVPAQAFGDYLKAIECWRTRIEMMNRGESIGLKGRPYMWSFANAAELMGAGADPAEVRDLYQKLEIALRDEVAALKEHFGATHRENELVLATLARFLQDQRRLPEAEAVWHEHLALEKNLSGHEHPRVADSLMSLGDLLQRSGKLPEAERAFRDAFAIRCRTLGNDHPDVATCLTSLDTVLKAQGKPTEAVAGR